MISKKQFNISHNITFRTMQFNEKYYLKQNNIAEKRKHNMLLILSAKLATFFKAHAQLFLGPVQSFRTDK